MKRWVLKTDLREIRPAESGEMVEPGQFSRSGDMIMVKRWLDGGDFLIREKDLDDYIEVKVPDDIGGAHDQ